MAMSMAGIAVYSSVDCSVPWLVLWRTRAQTAAYSIAGYYESLAMGRGICCRFNDLQCRDKTSFIGTSGQQLVEKQESAAWTATVG